MKPHTVKEMKELMQKGTLRQELRKLFIESNINTIEEIILPEVIGLLTLYSNKLGYDISDILQSDDNTKLNYLCEVNGSSKPSYKHMMNNIELLLDTHLHSASIYSILTELYYESTLLLEVYRGELNNGL